MSANASVMAVLKHTSAGLHSVPGACNTDLTSPMRERALALDEAIATVEAMAAALKSVGMLRQLGGIMPGSHQVVMVAVDQADEALARFNGSAQA